MVSYAIFKPLEFEGLENRRDRSVIGKHVRNIFKEGELEKESVGAKFEGKKLTA